MQFPAMGQPSIAWARRFCTLLSVANPWIDSRQLFIHILVDYHENWVKPVDLCIRTGHLVTVADQIIAMHRLKVDAALGKSFPLYCTASGKAVLAALPYQYCAGCTRWTARSVHA